MILITLFFRNNECEIQLKQMLELLRIKASTHVLSWVPDIDSEMGINNSSGYERLNHAYLKSACETVRRRSTETAVIFLYLPIPPSSEDYYVKYLDALSILSDNWPPTLMVRGVSPVTSTTL